MFSVGYHKQALLIRSISTNRIDKKNIERLRRLILQLLHNPCHKLILDLKGVIFIDITAFQVLFNLNQIANRHAIDLEFQNIDNQVIENFDLFSVKSGIGIPAKIGVSS